MQLHREDGKMLQAARWLGSTGLILALASAGLCLRPGPPILPDPGLTPGDVLGVTVRDICTPGYTKKVRKVPKSVKDQVYAEYGIKRHPTGAYEVDHLISLEIGGSNSIRNLWPQSYRTKPWNARVKDVLENELHRQVCAGQLDLKVAQRDIAANWIEAYKRYFHTDRPLAKRRPLTKRSRPVRGRAYNGHGAGWYATASPVDEPAPVGTRSAQLPGYAGDSGHRGHVSAQGGEGSR